VTFLSVYALYGGDDFAGAGASGFEEQAPIKRSNKTTVASAFRRTSG